MRSADTDGTPGAYYYQAGNGTGANKWYIHHQVGPFLADARHRCGLYQKNTLNFGVLCSDDTVMMINFLNFCVRACVLLNPPVQFRAEAGVKALTTVSADLTVSSDPAKTIPRLPT